MDALPVELLGTWTPFIFLSSGLLAASYRVCRKLLPGAGRQVEVDPDIRVRVTGKIS